MNEHDKTFPLAIGLLLFLVKHIKKQKDDALDKKRIEKEAIEQDLVSHIIKRRREAEDSNRLPTKGRSYVFYNHERAKSNVYDDYFSPTCTFKDLQFERIFRITKGMAEMILLECGNNSAFFTETHDALGKESICPKVKLLMALKLLGYGASVTPYVDYFQMGMSTAHSCFKHLITCLSQSTVFRNKYMRQMNRADAYRITELHHNQHGIDGMIGSLDCMHLFWKNCPVKWQGAFKGKEKKPSIVLEAMCDYNLWIWHSAFGYAGSQNDINIWEQSPLLQSFIDGTFSLDVDFEYEINGKVFTKLFLLVDVYGTSRSLHVHISWSFEWRICAVS